MIEQQLTIIAMRRQFIAKMNESLSRTYSALAEEEAQVSAAYHTITEQTEPDAMREEISRKLLENRERDRILKTTSSGVHRDDLSFQLNGRDVLSYASPVSYTHLDVYKRQLPDRCADHKRCRTLQIPTDDQPREQYY